jgi:glycosyltransferase involved in cell wall biosynthesis
MSDAVVAPQLSTNQAAIWPDELIKRSATLRVALLADAGHVNTQRWCEGLTRAGADIHVLSFRDGESKGWKVYPLPVLSLRGKLQYVASLPHVRRLIRRIKPQVLVSYYVTGYGTLGSLTGFHPIIQVTSGSDLLVAVRNPVMRQIVRHNLSRADLVTAWAPHMAEAALENGAVAEKLMVLPRGIPLQGFAAQRREKPTSNGIVRIISTRSLRSDYNLNLLLEAMHLLSKRGLQFTLTLAGDGPQRQELVSQTERLGLSDHVSFVGFVDNDALPSVLAQHDIYVALIPTDGVSASLLEAMAVGLFPIVPDHPANRLWVQHEGNGSLLDRLSASSVAKAIEQAASDVSLRERAWRMNAEIVQEQADLDRNCEQYVLRFRQLLQDKSADSY